MSKRKIRRPAKYVKPASYELPPLKDRITKKQKKQIIFGLVALLVLILAVVLWLVEKSANDGHLKIHDGAIVGAQDNWLITDLDDSKNKERYYKLAEVNTPEGYKISDEELYTTTSSDDDVSYETSFYFVPAQKDDALSMIYVKGISSSSLEITDSVYAMFMSMVADTGAITEIRDYNQDGKSGKYFSYHYSYDNDDGITQYTQQMVFYLDTNIRGSSILISVSPNTDSEADYLSEDAMLAYIQLFLDSITLNVIE